MRTFIAIEPSAKIKEALYRYGNSVKPRVWEGRFVCADNIHLTVFFIGETKKGEIAAIKEGMNRCTRNVSPFELTVEGLGTFQGRGGHILWAGVKESPPLQRLQACVQTAMMDLGFKGDDRPYNPHSTLARNVSFRGQTKDALSMEPSREITIPVTELTLMESRHEQGKHVYVPLVRSVLRTGNKI